MRPRAILESLHMAAAGLLCVALATPPAAASPEGPAVNGERVRVWSLGAPALLKEVATVVHRDGREMTLQLERSRRLVVVPCTAVARIEVSAGRRGHPWRGALVGAVVGLAAAFVADEIRGHAYRGDLKDPFLFGVGGGALGAALGAAVRTERWEPVDVGRWRVHASRASNVVDDCVATEAIAGEQHDRLQRLDAPAGGP